METLEFETVVVGGGVVGLALARHLALAGHDTVLLEKEPHIGSGISSRSSEVIHAGMYYEPTSLKARLCVAGRKALYAYCAERGVPHQRLGKLIVAVDQNECNKLQHYQQRALANGIDDLSLIDGIELARMEPALHAEAALFSPSTGIIDSHALMQSFADDFECAGGVLVTHSPLLQIAREPDGFLLKVGGRDPCHVRCRWLCNAAGMGAQALARTMPDYPLHLIPELYYAIGHYYALRGKSPFSRLVYPLAVAGGLGVHLTLDLAGQARFGPDISWRASEDYQFDDTRAAEFATAIQRYWPQLDPARLSPAYTGIRPKLWGPKQPEQDFMLQGPAQHGISGLLHLFGIESPGLTSCMALAEEAYRSLRW